MDKLSEYIPIIIILISVVISIVGKKKKPGKVTQETTLPGKPAREFTDKRELPRTESGSYRKVIEKNSPKQVLNQPEIVNKKEIESSFLSATSILESEEEGHSSFSFENEDDVKRAIIYAEIINKREY